jgi:methyl-accepting chemotaxis protein
MPTDESCMKCHPNFSPGDVDSMMVVSLPIDEAEARNAASMMNIVYVFAIAVILVLGLTYWLAGRITAPIKHLAEVADRVSKGDLDVNIDVTRGDEIGELAEAFNRLIASVKILSMSGDQ